MEKASRLREAFLDEFGQVSVCRSVEDGLLLREFEQAREAALTSDAALLVAAEGRGDVARGVVV